MTHTLKASMFAALLASSGLIVSAQAQTTTTPAAPMTPTPGSTSSSGATMGAPGGTTNAPMTTPNRSSTAMPGTSTTNSTAPAAVTTTTAPSRTTAAPVPGANSYTAGEARRRIVAKGFAQVKDLKKDEQGIWRGTAMKSGKSMSVSLDYQGNVVAQ